MADPPPLTPRQAAELVEPLRSVPGDIAEIRVGLPLAGRELAVRLVREALDAAGFPHVGLSVAPGASWARLLAVERIRRG